VETRLVNVRGGFSPLDPPDLSKQLGVFYSPEYIWEGPATLGAVPVSDAKLNATGRDFCQIWCD
jgi:hypothetical protein